MSYVDGVPGIAPLTFYLYKFDNVKKAPVKLQVYECYPMDISLQNRSLFRWEVIYLSRPQRKSLPDSLIAQGWKDFFKAMSFLLKRAEIPNYVLGREKVSEERNIPESFRRMKQLATGSMSCLPAQHFLGSCYLQPMFVAQDIDHAYTFFELAAKQGFLDAQLRIAKLCYQEYCFRMKKCLVEASLLKSQEVGTNKSRAMMHQMNLTDLFERSSVEHDKNLAPLIDASDREILELSLYYYKKADENPLNSRSDELTDLQDVTKVQALRYNMTMSELSRQSILSSVLFTVDHTTIDCISKVVQIWLYGFKDCFIKIYEPQYDTNLDALYLREGADLLYKNMDLQFDLLPPDTLRELLRKLASMIHKAIHFNPNNCVSSEEEVLDSYLADLPVMPKKSKKKKSPPSKKAKQAAEKLKQVSVPVPLEPPKVQIPDVVKQKTIPRKNGKDRSKPAQSQVTENHKAIREIFRKIVELEEMMKHYYIDKSKSSMKKQFQALFDKDDMSFADVNKLLSYIAEIEDGSVRLLTNGNGMNLLTLGQFTCGGHRPHHGEVHVDRGALTSLRSVLSSHYSSKIEKA